MNKKQTWLLLGIFIILLIACGGSQLAKPDNAVELQPPTATLPAGEHGTDSESEAESTGNPESAGDKEVELAEPVIVYERSGGMMGTLQTVEIYADGTVYETHTGKEFQTDSAEVDALLATLNDVGFYELDQSYMPKNECCDRFTYTITANDGKQTNTVTTMDGTDAPAAVWDSIDAIEAFLHDNTTSP